MHVIAYIPFKEGTNKYISRMKENLAAFGEVHSFPGFKPLLRREGRSAFKYYDAVILNWSENEILDPVTQRISVKATIRVFAQALAFRVLSRRVVFLRHNIYAHATAPKSRTAARYLMNIYERLFHCVITHSQAHVEGLREYCPCPLYKVDPGYPAELSALALPPKYFVIFGQIAPYKKIRELMLAVSPEVNLVIIGSVLDKSYDRELAAISRPNVFYRPGFVSESLAQTILAGADAAVIAHADADVVVSASFFYAVSFETSVIAVETPFLHWASRQLGSDVVAIAPDLNSLSAQMRNFTARALPPVVWQRVRDEFGDAAIRASLQTSLKLPQLFK